MKKIILLITVVFALTAAGYSQAPGFFNYQGVARNSVGNVLKDQTIRLRLTIHDGAANGPTVYQESRTVNTNPFGLFNVQIGSAGATNITGTIPTVNWGVSTKFIQVEIDPAGGTTFINIGTAQLASVPYSLFATSAGDLVLPFNKTQANAGTLFSITNSSASNGSSSIAGTTNGNGPSSFGVVGTANNGGFGVAGYSNAISVLGVAAATTGQAGRFETFNAANGTPTLGVFNAAGTGSGLDVNHTGTGRAGVFTINNAANGSDAVVASTNGTASSWALRATSTGLQGAGIFQYNNAAGTPNALRVLTNGTGFAANITSSNAVPLALRTQGGVQLTGLGETNNFVLRSDAAGNGTWVDPAVLLPGANFWSRVGTNLFNTTLTDNVGVGTNTPTHRFTVSHPGSTGISVSSTAGFSVVDINAASGDAALRFGNAGVNQWNMRNRPGDDYLEIFELGGGGSRVVIQDGTGNVGIGETANPTYKLDVLHGGSTGARIRSSASFSVVDIDAASGDAALRFVKAGVNQWNTRNRPADDYYEIFELGGGGSRLVIQDATGNVGIGETANPTYKLDVLHGGSTGIRSRSSSSFSVVDIDAASGDAALRFAKAGVNQWNTRNRPADDYYEIFELGGGGSRVVIQDGTGNVGIGETVAPSYKLDVLHGGSTGARIRSSSSFSVVDIDAQSGDAALRFVKAGVNQWNTRNRPADDYYEIFELGGGGSRFVIQDGTGNVGIGQTASPSYKLDVLHGGSTGARIQSSASFSVLDIDANSGDAALRYVKAGVNQWNVRNNPGTDDYQIFELGGGGERMRIENTTGTVVVNGDFTVVGTKMFTMDHPLDPANKLLRHAAAESNEVINFYSGNVTTDASGKATVQLPDYYQALNKDSRYQLTVIGSFAQAIISKEVSNNQFEIATSIPNVKVSWEVKGVRNDNHMKQNPFVAVQEKSAAQRGKYWDPKSHNQPESKGVTYDANIESSLNDTKPAAKKAAPATTGGSLEQGPIVPPATNKAVEKGGSLDEAPKVEAKPAPATKGGSLDEMPKPVENKKPATDPGSTKTE